MTKMVEVVGTRQDVGEKRVMKVKCSTKVIIITKIGGKCYFSCIAVFFKKDIKLIFSFVYHVLFTGLDYADPKKKSNFVGKVLLVATLTALCVVLLKQSPTLMAPSPVRLLSFLL